MSMDSNKRPKDEVIKSWIEHIDKSGVNLTDWEMKFIYDIKNKNVKYLSDKQIEIIERIYVDRTP